MQESNDDQCLDYKVKTRVSDSDVREYLNKLGIENISMLQKMEKGDRDRTLAKLKELEGVTIRQLSRVTGISKSVIQRAR
ncbi:hypothetical protein [Metabacillus sp. FJAT-53654]|uniref:HTH cro/C1-type domain-containing protein n=1 Tax=Metabacillus rhizosphaerae TaxID=3117747 RepID=A0ABZ2MWH0_9BACI